ncbi:MAG: outer membrane protein assembly factor BamC [Wenzhouxiangellaceae bacterium]|nr:outer membrane protein assembly factor BamC [Wenzhouxiangellaceae bacterium]
MKSFPNLVSRIPGLVALLALAGCGFLGPDQPVYVTSEEVPPIRVPPDLSPPETRSVFEIPGYSLPELAAQGDESKPPQVMSSAEAENARSRIRFGPTGLYLEVDDQAASVWRRLGFALNRGGMSVESVIEGERRFRVRFIHDPIVLSERGFFKTIFLFWKSPDLADYSGTYLFEVQRETGSKTRVAILDADGSILPMEQAEFVLTRLQQRLG